MGRQLSDLWSKVAFDTFPTWHQTLFRLSDCGRKAWQRTLQIKRNPT